MCISIFTQSAFVFLLKHSQRMFGQMPLEKFQYFPKQTKYLRSLFWTQSLDTTASNVGQGASQEKALGSESAYGLSTSFVNGWNISCTSKTGNRGLFGFIPTMPRRETQSDELSLPNRGRDSHVPPWPWVQWAVTVDAFCVGLCDVWFPWTLLDQSLISSLWWMKE